MLALKKTITASVRSPRVIGKLDALFNPNRWAKEARGKLSSSAKSMIHAGVPLFQTRPESPTPREELNRRLSETNWANCGVACQPSRYVNTSGSELTCQISPQCQS